MEGSEDFATQWQANIGTNLDHISMRPGAQSTYHQASIITENQPLDRTTTRPGFRRTWRTGAKYRQRPNVDTPGLAIGSGEERSHNTNQPMKIRRDGNILSSTCPYLSAVLRLNLTTMA